MRIKIPELPKYQTEKYENYSPISPDDFKGGQIYTNDWLFMWVTYLSWDNSADYYFWNGDGEYVRIDMSSSHNIYAIVTFLNNNGFRLLDYDLEVVNPYRTDEKILLTPNGTRKIKNKNECVKRNNNILENHIHRVVKDVINEKINNQNNTNMSAEELADWCMNIGDFLYIFEGLRGLKVSAANSNKIVHSIVNDILNCTSIEPTHEVDYLLKKREKEFENSNVCVFKLKGVPSGGDYYVVHEEDFI